MLNDEVKLVLMHGGGSYHFKKGLNGPENFKSVRPYLVHDFVAHADLAFDG